jgi:hypothetical protein
MFCSIEKLILYMHKSIPECYNMINSKITLGIMAIFAASVLVTGALIATPSYASNGGHKDKDGVSGDGNTNLNFKNINKQPIGGWDVDADNEQSNCIAFKGGECVGAFPIGPP